MLTPFAKHRGLERTGEMRFVSSHSVRRDSVSVSDVVASEINRLRRRLLADVSELSAPIFL